MESGLVTVTLVTYNSAKYVAQCLESVLREDYSRLEVIVVDNASTDGTPSILRQFEGRAQVIYNRENTGFTAGQNQAIELSRGEWVLVLNPDVRLMPDFVRITMAAGEADPRVGSVCGKLLRMSRDCNIPERPVFDSTGLYFTPAMRHFDRGSGEYDDGRYNRCEYVFGASGAAALYRREMIEDVSIGGEFFDTDFFAYREDADIAWRAQLLGWTCLYAPLAAAYHVRTVLPTNRRSVDPTLNMHSVKNRWLMRIKNMTPHLYRRTWFPATFRDAVVIAGCVFGEFRSIRGVWMVGRNLRRFLQKRQEIMSRRRSSDEYMAQWFSNSPLSYPAPEIEAAVLGREKIASR